MSENEDFVLTAIAGFIREQLGIPVMVVDGPPWKERQRLLDTGQIDIAWICGFPYILRADKPNPAVELLAAPVIQADRYGDRPLYFSDVVVHSRSRFREFSDLRGASWSYNEPYSHSGYIAVKYHLARLGEMTGYFGKVVESGSHLESLNRILSHDVDGAAVDSVVLGIELRNRPQIRSELRTIETLGPSPIPPLVVSKGLPSEVRNRLRRSLTQMHNSLAGQIALAEGQMVRLAMVEDSDYDQIRIMARDGRDVVLGQAEHEPVD